jgi:hypothetical protein
MAEHANLPNLGIAIPGGAPASPVRQQLDYLNRAFADPSELAKFLQNPIAHAKQHQVVLSQEFIRAVVGTTIYGLEVPQQILDDLGQNAEEELRQLTVLPPTASAGVLAVGVSFLVASTGGLIVAGAALAIAAGAAAALALDGKTITVAGSITM